MMCVSQSPTIGSFPGFGRLTPLVVLRSNDLFKRVRSNYVLHWPHARRGKGTSFRLEMGDDVLKDFTQLAVNLRGIFSVNPRDQVRTLPDVYLIFLAPFHPFMIPIARLHSWPSEVDKHRQKKT